MKKKITHQIDSINFFIDWYDFIPVSKCGNFKKKYFAFSTPFLIQKLITKPFKMTEVYFFFVSDPNNTLEYLCTIYT